jgi:hypothetical protein
MSAGASISGIGGLYYMIMFLIGVFFKADKKLKDARISNVTILIISLSLFIGLFSILFVYGIDYIHW